MPSRFVSGCHPHLFLPRIPCFVGNNPFKRNNLLVFSDQRSRVDKKTSHNKGETLFCRILCISPSVIFELFDVLTCLHSFISSSHTYRKEMKDSSITYSYTNAKATLLKKTSIRASTVQMSPTCHMQSAKILV